MAGSSFLCFESPAHATLYAGLYPEKAEHLFSFGALVEILDGPAPHTPAERLALFQQLDDEPDPRRAERTLQTIEILRAGLLQSSEDLTFLFAQLPTTPKNEKLQRAFARYLDSPLAEDFPARAWRAIDKVKHAANAALPAVTYFIPDSPAHFFFDEMAQAFQTAGASSTRLEAHELALSSPCRNTHRPFGYTGTAAEIITRLADRVAHLVARGTAPESILIPFAGDAGEHSLLGAALSFRGIAYQAINEKRERPKEQTLLERLRADSRLPLPERLVLARKWIALRAKYPRQSEGELLDLAGDDREAFASVAPAQRDVAKAASGAVRIFPFHPLPQDDRWHVLSYIGRSALEPPHGSLLLREAELEALHRQGFCIPRLSAHRSRLKSQIEIAGRGTRGRRELFSALPAEEMDFGLRTFPLPSRLLREKDSTHDVRIPISKRALSATQLETYAKCPMQYFYSQVLRVRKQDAGGEDSFALWFGSSAHLALENYLRRPRERILASELREEFELSLQECAQEVPEQHPLKSLAREKFSKMAGAVEKLEEELTAIVGPHAPQQFELPFKVPFEGIELTGKIDRLDQRETLGSDGPKEWVILDYKTGSVDFTPEHIRKGKNFQALLYWIAAERLGLQPLAGMLFYDLKEEELRRGIFKEEALTKEAKKRLTRGHALPKEKLEPLLEEGLAQLRTIAQKILDGEFTATPSPASCDYCDYGTLCRKGTVYG